MEQSQEILAWLGDLFYQWNSEYVGWGSVYCLFAAPFIAFATLSGLRGWGRQTVLLVRAHPIYSRIRFCIFGLDCGWCIFECPRVVTFPRDWHWAKSVSEYFRNLQRDADFPSHWLQQIYWTQVYNEAYSRSDGIVVVSLSMSRPCICWWNNRLCDRYRHNIITYITNIFFFVVL